jgi:hypothetical protein
MTWIVGGASPFGHAFVVGDTRVTFSDGLEADLVRKVYWVGSDIAAGFSGSVRIGFHLLSHLSRGIQGAGSNVIWKPEATMKQWSAHAAEIFAAHDEAERAARCSILVAAAAPDNNGPFARTTLVQLSSPKFKPRVVPRFGSLQVGSGREHLIYRQWAEDYFKDPSFVTNFAMWEGSIGSVLASSLSTQVLENPKTGVSPFMHVVACGRGTKSEGKVPGHFPWDPDPFPEVATSYARFCRGGPRIDSAL